MVLYLMAGVFLFVINAIKMMKTFTVSMEKIMKNLMEQLLI